MGSAAACLLFYTWLYIEDCFSSGELRDPGYAHVDFGNFIPGGIICNPCLWQPEDSLELPHCLSRGRSVNAVCVKCGESWIGSGNNIQLLLELTDFRSGGADFQIVARPGGGNAGDGLCGVNVHVIPVVVAEDLNGRVALVSQRF